MYGKRLKPTESIKYIGVKSDFSWQHHVSDFFIKLNRANALFFTMRKYVRFETLRSIYFVIFDFHLSYCYTMPFLNTQIYVIHRSMALNPSNIIVSRIGTIS